MAGEDAILRWAGKTAKTFTDEFGEVPKKMAADAKKMREDAADTCKRQLDEASDAGIQNRKWWEKAVKWVSDNWDTIIAVCKVIVAVLRRPRIGPPMRMTMESVQNIATRYQIDLAGIRVHINRNVSGVHGTTPSATQINLYRDALREGE